MLNSHVPTPERGKDPQRDMLVLPKAAFIPFPNFGSSEFALGVQKIRSAALTIDGDTCGEWTTPSWSPGLEEIEGRERGFR